MIHSGSTVLIVSHSTDTIIKNCTRAVWIEKGVLKESENRKRSARPTESWRAEAPKGRGPYENAWKPRKKSDRRAGMTLRMSIYGTLVNRVPEIREKYHMVRDAQTASWQRPVAWLYLAALNAGWLLEKDSPGTRAAERSGPQGFFPPRLRNRFPLSGKRRKGLPGG